MRHARKKTPWSRRRRRSAIALVAVLLLFSPWLLWRFRLKAEVRENFEAVRAMGVPLTEEERAAWLQGFPAKAETTLFQEAGAAYVVLPVDVVDELPTFRTRNEEVYLYARPYPEEALAAMRAALDLNTETVALLRQAIDIPPNSTESAHGARDEFIELYCADACVRAAEGDGAGAVSAVRAGLRYLDCSGAPYASAALWPSESLAQLLDALFSAASQTALPDGGLEEIAAALDPGDWVAQYRNSRVDGLSRWASSRGEFGRDAAIQVADILFGIVDRHVNMQLESWIAEQQLAGKSWAEQERAIEALRDKPWENWVHRWSPPEHFDLARIAIEVLRFHGDHGTLPASLEELVPAYRNNVPVSFQTGQPFIYAVEDTCFSVSLPLDEEGASRRNRRNEVLFRACPPAP